MKFILFLSKTSFFIALFLLYSCDDDDNNNVITPPTETIADFIANNEDYSSLIAALDLTDLRSLLDNSAKFTVFAPNNTAFDLYLQNAGFTDISEIDTPEEIAELTQLLRYHILEGDNRSSSFNTGYINTSSTYTADTNEYLNMYIEVNNGIVAMNGGGTAGATGASIIEADLPMSNGTVHRIDAVIQLPTIVTFATLDPNLSILAEGLDAYDFTYTTTLQQDGPFTLFAPNNNAFTSLFNTDPTLSTITDIAQTTLAGILNLHVVSGQNLRSQNLVDGSIMTLGGTITVDAINGALTDGSDPVVTSTLITTDLQTANGVIHLIDSVLITPQ